MSTFEKSAGDGIVSGSTTQTGLQAASHAEALRASAHQIDRRRKLAQQAGALYAFVHAVETLLGSADADDPHQADRLVLCGELSTQALLRAETLRDLADDDQAEAWRLHARAQEVQALLRATCDLFVDVIDTGDRWQTREQLLDMACAEARAAVQLARAIKVEVLQ